MQDRSRLRGIGQLENFHLSTNKLDMDGVEPELATRLLEIYWSRVNSLSMLVYRPAFNKSWQTGGHFFSKLLLNAIYFSASRFMTDDCGVINSTMMDGFRNRFKHLLAAAYDKSRVATLQGLLIVSTSVSAIGKDRSMVWLYSGLAYRMLVDLGLHTNKTALGQGEEETEIARRIFWAAFGRPSYQ